MNSKKRTKERFDLLRVGMLKCTHIFIIMQLLKIFHSLYLFLKMGSIRWSPLFVFMPIFGSYVLTLRGQIEEEEEEFLRYLDYDNYVFTI